MGDLNVSMLAEATGAPVVEAPKTLHEGFKEVLTSHPYNRAVLSLYQPESLFTGVSAVNDGQGYLNWTYTELDQSAERLARSLHTRGLRSGMRLAVFLLNGAEWALLFWASVKLNATFVALDEGVVPRSEEVDHYLSVTKPSAVFVSSNASARTLLKSNYDKVDAIAIKAITAPTEGPQEGWYCLKDFVDEVPVFNGSDSLSERKSHRATPEFRPPEVAPSISFSTIEYESEHSIDSVVYITFTSGSAGIPKACPVTNRNIWAGEMAGNGCDPRNHEDVVLALGDPSHSMCLAGMLHAWINGAALVIPAPKFEIKATLDAIASIECTHMGAIPTMLLALLKQPAFHPEKTRSLKAVSLGGTIISPSTVTAVTDAESVGASDAIVAFGMTEGLPVCGASTNGGVAVDRGIVSMGKPLPGVKVKICQHQSRRTLTRGQIGELHFGGDLLIRGYLYGDNQVFYEDHQGRWIATGDEAMMDAQGDIFILGRYKDIIIRGGLNLSPALIENCFAQAGVVGQVVGIPDDIAGEVPVAVIQMPENASIPKKELNELIIGTMGSVGVPTTYISLVELGLSAFPLTTSAKVRKAELKHIVLGHLSRSLSEKQSSSNNNVVRGCDISAVHALCALVASLIGQSPSLIPEDQPLSTMLDSINILRLQASISKTLGKTVSMDSLIKDPDLVTLASEVERASITSPVLPRNVKRKGPPMAADMVHVHGDPKTALRTKAQATVLLEKHGMGWDDVEDIYPMPPISSGRFEAMRPKAFSIRFIFAIRHITSPALRDALERTLERWSIYRSFAMKFDNTPLFIIVKPNKAMLEASIAELPAAEGKEALSQLRFPEKWSDDVHFSSGCPLARFALCAVQNTDLTGLMILAHHATYDALSFQAFTRDLAANIRKQGVEEPLTDYKLFADMHYQYRNCVLAQDFVSYHARRLRGIGSLRENIWPPQRCPGWFIGDDTGYAIPASAINPLHEPRSQVDHDNGHAGMLGIHRVMPLLQSAELSTTHRISNPMLFKAACAILGSHLSGSSEVCFANSQAGRAWPFLDASLAGYLPNPVTIGGNTLGLVINRIEIHRHSSVLSLLTHLEQGQELLTKQAHAPIADIAASLHPADALVFNEARRQLLNWNPTLSAVANQEDRDEVEVIRIEGYTDVILEWHCGMSGSNAILAARWDGTQFGKATVERWVEAFMKILSWIGDIDNCHKRIEDLALEILV